MPAAIDTAISNAISTQDLELAQAITDLKGDPAALAAFVTGRKSELYNAVTLEHSDTFKKVYGDYQRASDTNNNILYYYIRNNDLNTLQGNLVTNAENTASAAQHDSHLAKRQYEINEWTGSNKADTLFVFQMILIALSVSAPLLYLQRKGILPMSVFIGITALLFIAILCTIIVRAQYTNVTRDTRFWNRRRFPGMGGPPVAPTCQAVVTGLNSAANTASTVAENILG